LQMLHCYPVTGAAQQSASAHADACRLCVDIACLHIEHAHQCQYLTASRLESNTHAKTQTLSTIWVMLRVCELFKQTASMKLIKQPCTHESINFPWHINACSDITTRHDPIDLALRSLKVEEFHVNTVLPLLGNIDPREIEPQSHADAELPQVVSGHIVTHDTLPE